MKKILSLIVFAALTVSAFAQTITVNTNGQPNGAGLAIPFPNSPPLVLPNTDSNGVPSISGGFKQILDALVNGTNVIYEVHGLYAPGLNKKDGGGFGVFYPVSQYVFTGIRLDYADGGFWMPSGNVGVQFPISITSWLKVTPFTYAGIAVPVSGAMLGSFTVPGQVPRDNNGQPTAILGAGGAINLYTSTSGKWSYALAGDIEEWTGFPGKQYRFAALIHRNF